MPTGYIFFKKSLCSRNIHVLQEFRNKYTCSCTSVPWQLSLEASTVVVLSGLSSVVAVGSTGIADLVLNSRALEQKLWPLLACLAAQPAHSYFYHSSWKICVFWENYISGHNSNLHPQLWHFLPMQVWWRGGSNCPGQGCSAVLVPIKSCR